MSSATREFYPLAKTTNKDLAQICEALWDWSPCPQWIRSEACPQLSTGCQCSQASRHEPFFNFYRNTTAYYLPDAIGSSQLALRCHGDLRDLVVLLRNNPDKTRCQLAAEYFTSRETPEGEKPPTSDQKRALNLAVRIITMVQSAAENQTDGLLETGLQPPTWAEEQSLGDFMNSVFPKRQHSILTGR
jgi:hypothetical protein